MGDAMSYAAARAQIVAALEGITGLDHPATFGQSLREQRDARPDDIPHSRAFTVAAVGGSTSTREGSAAGRQTLLDVTASIFYREVTDDKLIDEVLISDYVKIRDTLLEPSNWGRPSSGIVLLSAGGAEAMTFSVEGLEVGRVLDVTFPMTISASTS